MPKAPAQSDIDEFVRSAAQGYLGYVIGSLKQGMPVDAVDESGATALFAAARAGKTDVITVLVAADAQVNMSMPHRHPVKSIVPAKATNWERTALNAAAAAGQSEALQLLLDYGADPRLGDGGFRTPAHHVVSNADKWMRLSEGEALMAKALGRMFDYGVRINQTTSYGRTILHEAVYGGCPEPILDLLLARGARVDARDGSYKTAVHLAKGNEAPRLIQWLVRNGADVNAQCRDGMTALFERNSSAFETLIALGIDVDLRDSHGRTALNYLVQLHPANTSPTNPILTLLGTGADIDLPDHAGNTARSVIKARRMAELKPLVAARDARDVLAKRAAAARRTTTPST